MSFNTGSSIENQEALRKIESFFNPRSIAIIGVSRKEYSMGWTVFKNMLENREKGILKAKVYGVNIKGGELFGQKLYKSILEIPDEIDLAVVLIPAKFVPNAIKEAGEKGVKAAIIVSAGFAEVGNYELDQQLRNVVKEYGIRVIGPNCIGILDNHSGVDTLFLPLRKKVEGKIIESMPRPSLGHVTFLSQSGALGGTVLDYMYGQNIGIAKFINFGNKIDVDEVEMLQYLKDDPFTRVIMIYIEGIYGENRGRELYEVAKEVTKKKPIVVLKGGKTKSGSRAVASHTASIAGNIRIYKTAFKEAGMLYANSIPEFTDMTKALVYQPPAKGNRIVVITNGGGPGILTADYAEFIGLNIIELPKELKKRLEEKVNEGVIPNVATFSNPIDLSASASEEAHAVALEEALKTEEVDGVIFLALHHPPAITETFVDKIVNVMKKYDKPCVVVDVGSVEMAQWVRRKFDENGIPSYDTPERAAVGMKALVEYGEYLQKVGEFENYIEKIKAEKSK